MARIQDQIQSLSKLKASQLHQLAVALGSACSGNKATIISGILRTLTSAPSDGFQASHHLASSFTDKVQTTSIISIDMGIQNLAFAHLLAPQLYAGKSRDAHAVSITHLPILGAWERLNVFPVQLQDGSGEKSAKAGLYNPSRYANAAYRLITSILKKYNPEYILIEQQRFRSSGNSAVAEWTIRVGVFEGMLHAVLQTLREENKGKSRLPAVASISPARTVHFWLRGSGRSDDSLEPKKITGRDGKQAKIDIVGQSFLDPKHRLVDVAAGQAKAMEVAFMEKWHATSKAAKVFTPKKIASAKANAERRAPKQFKLDDLADCLLQGMAWLEWQRMRQLVLQDLNSKEPMHAIQHKLESLSQNKGVPRASAFPNAGGPG